MVLCFIKVSLIGLIDQAQIQGEIVAKNAIPGVSSTSYKVQVQGSEESEDLYLDHYSYKELEIGQFINATYLPHRQEVITCKILPITKEDTEQEERESLQESN